MSRLGGEIDVPARSVSRTPWWARRSGPTETWSTQRQRRLPVDAVHQQPPQSALVLQGPSPPMRVTLETWWAMEPFRRAPPAPERDGSGPAPVGPTRDPEDRTPAPEPPVIGAGPGYQAAPW